METPDELDRISDRQERQGAKIFFRALKKQYAEMARQVENGQDPQPNEQLIKNALISYHSRVQWEIALWQYNDLERRNPVKSMQIGHQERVLGLIRTWIALNLGKSIKSISDTSRAQILKLIAEGQDQGWGARKIAAQIRKNAVGSFTAYRATVISRTEGTRAASHGAKVGAEQWESITGQQKWKTWSAVNQARTRDAHIAMLDSLPIPGDQDFIVGGAAMDGPGDPRGGGANTINCRCRRYYMSERMAKEIIAKAGGSTPSLEPAESYTAQLYAQLNPKPIAVPQIKPPKVPKPKPAILKPTIKPDNGIDDAFDIEERRLLNAHYMNPGSIDADIGQRFKRDYKNTFPEVVPEGVMAINDYSDNGYGKINRFLRHPDRSNFDDTFKVLLKAKANQMNKALDQMPKHKGIVYRGTSIEEGTLAHYKRAFETGEPHIEKAFVSTSPTLQRSFGTNIIFKINSKTGVLIEDISEHRHETEVLFKFGKKFKITDYQEQNGQILISMDEY